MKKCPFCSEKIQDSAVKCRFCGEFLKDFSEKKDKKNDSKQAVFSQLPSKKNNEKLKRDQDKIIFWANFFLIFSGFNVLYGLAWLIMGESIGLYFLIIPGILLTLGSLIIKRKKQGFYVGILCLFFIALTLIKFGYTDKLFWHSLLSTETNMMMISDISNFAYFAGIVGVVKCWRAS